LRRSVLAPVVQQPAINTASMMPSRAAFKDPEGNAPSPDSVAPLRPVAGAAGPLLSIHLTSNRPGNFVDFLNRLEQSTSDMSSVEVVVKIDDADAEMNRLLEKEAATRPFRITYLSTPLSGGFFGLWRSYDELLNASDPNAYFVIGLNDEMSFRTQGWNNVLRKYVGLFPDHIFRLRSSLHRYRNYYDFWEPGFANDTSAFMTRRWLTLGGGWCPCNGPDTFQECVAYYFGWLDRFNNSRTYRDIPITDIDLEGHGASLGLSGKALHRRIGGSLVSHFTLMSHRMQEEAARRARKLHAHIWIHEQAADRYEVRDNRARRRLEIVDRHTGAVCRTFGYRLNAARIGLSNMLRKLNCGYYLAGGSNNRLPWFQNFFNYLMFRYEFVDHFADAFFGLARRLRIRQ
jgi:hypothetical protein